MRNKAESTKGFTLVELLVVSGVFIIITTSVVSILFIVLRGIKKSDSIRIVRQNGEQAMAQMVRMMRFAESLDGPCPFTDSQSVTITEVNFFQTTFTCPSTSPVSPPNYISSNGAELTNKDTVIVQECFFSCAQQAGSSPTIGISFTLSKLNLSSLPEEDTRISFKNSVTLRNIGGQ